MALSVVYPEDDPHLPGEVQRLRTLLPAALPLLVGGRAAAAYRSALAGADVTYVASLGELYAALEGIRSPRAAGARNALADVAPRA